MNIEENPIDISSGSLPLASILFADLHHQARLIEGIYDGIEGQLTNGLAIHQLLKGTSAPEKYLYTGLHQSARTERIFTRNSEDRINSVFGLAFYVLMKHRFDSLADLNILALHLENPDIPTVLYPSESGVEQEIVASLNKLFQPKIEVAQMFKLLTTTDWDTYLEKTNWAGLCFDTQHSTRLFPGQELKNIRKHIKRIHVSIGRTDLESHDTAISLDEVLKDQRNGLLFPLLLTLLNQPNGARIPLVVETPPSLSPDQKQWRQKHAEISGTLRKWLTMG